MHLVGLALIYKYKPSAFVCQPLVHYKQLAGKLWNAAVVEDVAALLCYQPFAGLFVLQMLQQLMTVKLLQQDLTVVAAAVAAVARALTHQLALVYKMLQKLTHLIKQWNTL